MKKNYIKLLITIAAAVLLMVTLSFSSFAGVTEDYSYTVLDNGTVRIDRFHGKGSSVIIPSEIDGKKVTIIGSSAFENEYNLTELVIPEGVTTIGEYAFRYCSALNKLTLPESLEYIKYEAFMGCYALKNINVHENIKGIHHRAFDYTAWYDSQPAGVVYLGNCLYRYKGICLRVQVLP